VVPRLGIQTTKYAFRTYPYASRLSLIGEYATGIEKFRVTSVYDKRREGTSLHLTALARMSEIEVVNFHGFGNDTPESPGRFYEARQRQWLFQPAVALALGPRSDLFAGPVIQYSTTDSIADRFLSEERPYGFGNFGQAGLRVGLMSDGRNRSKYPSSGLLLEGRGTVRRLDRERYAGDAALAGTIELQIPIAKFGFVLPLDVGIYGFADAGRVYFEGESPGGWHRAAGIGTWVGILNPVTAISLEFGDQRGRTGIRIRTGLTF
jgi:hypothetical protein